VPFPVLRIGGVIFDRGIEPDAVAVLLTLIEGRLERLATAASTAPAPATATPSPRPLLASLAALVVLAVPIILALVGRALLLLGLGLLELRLDLRLDLVAKVDVAVGFLALGGEAVAASEIPQLGRRDAELMRDPCIGPALANPGANLIELWSQGLASHRRRTLDDSELMPWQARQNPLGYLFLGSRLGIVCLGVRRRS
jgi:hypothetical protein